jgi:NADH-quinone oxidoreductase subunit N
MIILLPVLLFAGSIFVILLDAFSADSARKSYGFTILILLATFLASFFLWPYQGSAFQGMIVLDSFSLVATALFCLAGLITLLLLHDSPLSTAQFHSLLLLTLIGMILLVSGTNFVVLFIGLEILSLSIYVLAAFAKGDPLSAESGMKYFLLGSFASAFFLYGVAFVYGATGSIQLNAVADAIASTDFANQKYLYLGVVFLLVGYGFKISLAPFHMWTPDVYEGAPTPVTAFMAATVKAAALASLIRVFLIAFPGETIRQFWAPLIWILAVVTMSAGNLTAIWQNNLKRLLAYSSIAHAGYMLLGLLAAPDQAQQSILYYFAAYIFMNLGAFAVIAYLEKSEGILNIEQYQNLAYSRPILATCMMLFLVSLGGLPPTAGFFGKFYLFKAVLQEGYVWGVIIAVLNSAISFYYYLKIVIAMFTPAKEEAAVPVGAMALPLIVSLIITVWGTLSLGLFPGFFLELARAVSIL